MRDMISNKQVVNLGTLALSGTTPAASGWVDTRVFDAATIVLVNNTITDAGDANGFTATCQHSDDITAASAANIAAADSVTGATTIQVTSDAADNVVAGGIGYKGSKRYVRLNVVGTTGTNAGVTVLAVLNVPHRAATTFAGTSIAAT